MSIKVNAEAIMPMKLELVVNLTTAKALGMTILKTPPLRADRVIE